MRLKLTRSRSTAAVGPLIKALRLLKLNVEMGNEPRTFLPLVINRYNQELEVTRTSVMKPRRWSSMFWEVVLLNIKTTEQKKKKKRTNKTNKQTKQIKQ